MNKWKGILISLAAGICMVASCCIASGITIRWGATLCLDPDDYYRLPAEASQVVVHDQLLNRSCTVWTRFELPPAALHTFVRSTFISWPLSSTDLPQSLGDINQIQARFANPALGQLTAFLAGEARGPSRYLDEQALVVDTSDPQRYVVYLVTKNNWL